MFHSVEEIAFPVRERSFAILREIQQDIAPQILDLTAAALKGTGAAVATDQDEGHAADLATLARAWDRHADGGSVAIPATYLESVIRFR